MLLSCVQSVRISPNIISIVGTSSCRVTSAATPRSGVMRGHVCLALSGADSVGNGPFGHRLEKTFRAIDNGLAATLPGYKVASRACTDTRSTYSGSATTPHPEDQHPEKPSLPRRISTEQGFWAACPGSSAFRSGPAPPLSPPSLQRLLCIVPR